jgi:hypothetical protein
LTSTVVIASVWSIDQVAAGLQRHLLLQRALDLVLDAVQVEDRALAR